MPRRLIVAMLGLGLALFLMPQVSLAVDDHILQAIEYTKIAIDDGQHGRADGLVVPPERYEAFAKWEEAERSA